MTYGTMQDRIADELSRSDLTTQIQRAIQTAIAHYSNTRFHFNEGRWEATSTAAVEYYPFPNDAIAIDTMRVTVNSNTYTLIREDWSTIDNFYTSNYVGYPQYYGVYANQIRLYPIPNDEFPMLLTGVKELSALSDADGTNEWMVSGEELIRARAKADLYSNVLMEPNRAAEMAGLATVAETSLARRTAQMNNARLRPTRF